MTSKQAAIYWLQVTLETWPSNMAPESTLNILPIPENFIWKLNPIGIPILFNFSTGETIFKSDWSGVYE